MENVQVYSMMILHYLFQIFCFIFIDEGQINESLKYILRKHLELYATIIFLGNYIFEMCKLISRNNNSTNNWDICGGHKLKYILRNHLELSAKPILFEN